MYILKLEEKEIEMKSGYEELSFEEYFKIQPYIIETDIVKKYVGVFSILTTLTEKEIKLIDVVDLLSIDLKWLVELPKTIKHYYDIGGKLYSIPLNYNKIAFADYVSISNYLQNNNLDYILTYLFEYKFETETERELFIEAMKNDLTGEDISVLLSFFFLGEKGLLEIFMTSSEKIQKMMMK